jgi:hypothetical protein
MSALLFVLASVVASALAAPTPACIPDKTQFYWKTPCDGQSFTNRIQVSSVDASEGGTPVDKLGGFDISQDINLHAAITDQYGSVTTPLIDVGLLEYTKGASGSCEWKQVPTLGLLDNIDGCTIVQNCHLTGSPTTMDATINVKKLAGALYAGISIDTYYALTMTFKDGKNNPFLCVYSQDIVIKK